MRKGVSLFRSHVRIPGSLLGSSGHSLRAAHGFSIKGVAYIETAQGRVTITSYDAHVRMPAEVTRCRPTNRAKRGVYLIVKTIYLGTR